jgi:hypothetical protein
VAWSVDFARELRPRNFSSLGREGRISIITLSKIAIEVLFGLLPLIFIFVGLCRVRFINHLGLKVGCLHPVACTRPGSGFPSIKRNVALDANPEPNHIGVYNIIF